MTASAIQTLITDSLTDFGDAGLVILTAVIGIAVAYFLFRWGWRKIKGSVH